MQHCDLVGMANYQACSVTVQPPLDALFLLYVSLGYDDTIRYEAVFKCGLVGEVYV